MLHSWWSTRWTASGHSTCCRWPGSGRKVCSWGNGKKGCKAVKLINLLDPLGKVFFTDLWERARPCGCYFSYGFYKGKRRESAILVQNAAGWNRLNHDDA